MSMEIVYLDTVFENRGKYARSESLIERTITKRNWHYLHDFLPENFFNWAGPSRRESINTKNLLLLGMAEDV